MDTGEWRAWHIEDPISNDATSPTTSIINRKQKHQLKMNTCVFSADEEGWLGAFSMVMKNAKQFLAFHNLK